MYSLEFLCYPFISNKSGVESLSNRFQSIIVCSKMPGEGLCVKCLLQNPPGSGSCHDCIKGLFHSKNFKGK